MSRFPSPKRFAFTVFDDTDFSTLENTRPVYELLADLGFRTTKSVWPLACDQSDRHKGDTLQDKPYLDFVFWLRALGFEIALHNVRNVSSERPVIEKGLVVFRVLIGEYPKSHCNHLNNRDNLYWASQRLTCPAIQVIYNLATYGKRIGHFQGEKPRSPFFWGDLCKERITYVRNMVFDEINLGRINPSMPYYNPAKPYVNFWFSGSNGDSVESFCGMVSEENQDRLEAEGGFCIMYTHFGSGFYVNGQLNPEFKRLMQRLAAKNGWFVPVATLLDHLRTHRDGQAAIPPAELKRMERRWLAYKLKAVRRWDWQPGGL